MDAHSEDLEQRRQDGVYLDALGAKVIPETFFDEAIIGADETLAETTGACKEGMGIAYDGRWVTTRWTDSRLQRLIDARRKRERIGHSR